MRRRSITRCDLAVVPDHDDGPITITIDYLIASEDREQFGMSDARSAGSIPAQRRIPMHVSTKIWISPACSVWNTMCPRGLSIFVCTCE